jgi:hypothetical protein
VHAGVSVETYRRTERYIVITGNPLLGSKDVINIDKQLDATVAELDAKRQKPGMRDRARPKMVGTMHVRMTRKKTGTS